MNQRFCPKCGKPKQYTGKGKHLVKCCDCEGKLITSDIQKEGSEMKKWFLGFALLFLIGCSGDIVLPDRDMPDIYVRGGDVTSEIISADNTIITVQGLNVTSIKYEILSNVGGAGTIGIGITTYGGDCSIVTPVLTVNISALTDTPAPIDAPELVTLQNSYYAVGQHRICLFYTQADINDRINFTLNFLVTISDSYDFRFSGM